MEELTFLEKLVEQRVLTPLDLFFAKKLSQEEGLRALLSYLFAISQEGHLCLRMENDTLEPHPKILQKDKELMKDNWEAPFMEKIMRGYQNLPPHICSRVEDEDLIPNTPLCLHKHRLYLQKKLGARDDGLAKF